VVLDRLFGNPEPAGDAWVVDPLRHHGRPPPVEGGEPSEEQAAHPYNNPLKRKHPLAGILEYIHGHGHIQIPPTAPWQPNAPIGPTVL
jgi:hypothetical protein